MFNTQISGSWPPIPLLELEQTAVLPPAARPYFSPFITVALSHHPLNEIVSLPPDLIHQLHWEDCIDAFTMPVVNGVTTVMATPEGYVVDFDNPQRTGVPEVYFVAGFGIVLSLLFTAQRLYVNAVVEKGLQVDDGELAVPNILVSLFYFLLANRKPRAFFHMHGSLARGITKSKKSSAHHI